VENSAL